MLRKMQLTLMVGLIVMAVSFTANAAVEIQWSGSLESLGGDVSWDSSTALRAGYNNYYYDCDFTQVEVKLDVGEGMWMDYSPAFNADSAGLSDGLAASVLSSVYDTNELDFNLTISIDEDGFAHASLTNVVFGDPWAGANIIGIRFAFNLKDAAVKKVWGDDFNSYGVGRLGDSTDWTTGWEGTFPDPYVGERRAQMGTYPGKVWMRDDWYGGFPDSWDEKIKTCIADGVDSHHLGGVELTDYIVAVTAAKRDAGTLTRCNYYLLSRVANADTHINFCVGWGPYAEKFYGILQDTAGDGVVDPIDASSMAQQYIAEIDISKPIYMTLKVQGNDVTATAEHNGGKAVMRYQTTFTAGEPGFGGEWQWGYMDSFFDNFAVYTVVAEDPTMCGEDGTIYLTGDINEDCSVDLFDLSEMAVNWLVTQ